MKKLRILYYHGTLAIMPLGFHFDSHFLILCVDTYKASAQ